MFPDKLLLLMVVKVIFTEILNQKLGGNKSKIFLKTEINRL